MSANPVIDFDLAPIFAHAAEELPRECCGLVVRVDRRIEYWPSANLARGTNHFIINPALFALAEDRGEVLAVVHSHVVGTVEPSMVDRVSCDQGDLPWLIVSATGHHAWLYPNLAKPVPPLLERPYAWGVFDCLSLVRDYYDLELDIEIPHFQRPPYGWAKAGRNDLVDSIEAAGFRRVPKEDLQPHDVLLMQVEADVPSHLAVYVGDGRILHQLENRLSGYAVYGGYWQRAHVLTARHWSAP